MLAKRKRNFVSLYRIFYVKRNRTMSRILLFFPVSISIYKMFKYTCMLFLAAVLVRLSLIISDFDLLRKFSCMILLPYDINYFKVQKLYTNHPYFLELSIITTEPLGIFWKYEKCSNFCPKDFLNFQICKINVI